MGRFHRDWGSGFFFYLITRAVPTSSQDVSTIDIKSSISFSEEYTYEHDGTFYYKKCTYYLGYVEELITGSELDEISQTRWLSFEDAKKTLSHKEAIAIVEQLESYLLKAYCPNSGL